MPNSSYFDLTKLTLAYGHSNYVACCIGHNVFDFGQAVRQASVLVYELDANLVSIIVLSLQVSISAVIAAAIVGLPIGAALAVSSFRGRHAITILMNALMGLPPVVVGLVVYVMLSRAGPLGAFGILLT